MSAHERELFALGRPVDGGVHGRKQIGDAIEGRELVRALGDPGRMLENAGQGGDKTRPVGCVQCVEGNAHFICL